MNPDQPNKDFKTLTRRGFISWGAAISLGFVSFFAFLATILRMPFPSLLPGKSNRFKIGLKNDFPKGTETYFENDQVHVFADAQGIYAISAVCTHLGCIVNREENGFICPCHGSRYSPDGKVIQGAAPKGLPWYKITMLPSGQMEVDKKQIVKPGVKFNV